MLAELVNTERRFRIDLNWNKIVDAAFAELVLARGLPAFVNRLWSADRDPSEQLPGTILLHQSHACGFDDWLLDFGKTGLVFVERGPLEIRVRVGAAADAQAHALVQRFREAIPERAPEAAAPSAVFWSKTGSGHQGVSRKLAAPSWGEIGANYPEPTRSQLEPLFDERWRPANGRLLLWHGPPGTGKTYALRSLMLAWRDWCSAHVVVDPEKFLGTDSDYMLDVLGHEPQDDFGRSTSPRPAWRLLVMEDSGELIAMDSASRTGQGLSRLLNLCDGLLGQSYNCLILITTNEVLGRLHPAISRTGRCISNVEFELFDATAAHRWLRRRDTNKPKPVERASLADLFGLLNGNAVTCPQPSLGFGSAQ